MTVNLTSIILNQEDWRENDAWLTIYTRELGKLEAAAKGVRKKESKLASHLEPLATAEMFIVRGRSWPIVAGSSVISPRFSLRNDWGRLTAAGAAVNLVDLMTPLESPDERIYNLLDELLSIFADNFLEPPAAKLLVFMLAWKMLSLTGYRPQLKICVQCRRQSLGERFYFFPRRGGVIHGRCSAPAKDGKIEIKENSLKGLAYMLEAPISSVLRLRGPRSSFEEMAEVIVKSFEERMEMSFPAMSRR